MATTAPDEYVQTTIESACSSILAQLASGNEELTFSLRRRRTSSQHGHARTVTLSFPGKTAEDTWRFTVVLRILQIVHEALLAQIIITKRHAADSIQYNVLISYSDIYYRDPALFGSQAVVDRYIEDIALTFEVSRSQLNVTAAAKGLLRGPMTIRLKNGTGLDAMASQDGLSMPAVQGIASVDLRNVRWILVIEKEATFHALLSSSSVYEFLNHGLIVTAKGYPDVATRQLLQIILREADLPTLALVDFDPDGLAIYSNYKYGPLSQMSAIDITLPSMQLLGLRSEHVQTTYEQGTLSLTARDRRRAINMLRHDPVAQEEDVRLDIQRMLMLGIKAELQHLHAHNNGLIRLLYESLSQL